MWPAAGRSDDEHGGFHQASRFRRMGLIAAAAGGTVNDEFQPLAQVWRVPDGEPLVTLTGYTQVNISGVADLLRFSLDGRYLMAGHSDGSIAVWNIPDGTLRMFIGGLRSNLPVSDLAMSADGESLLAAYANQAATLWDLTKSREPVTWSGRLAGISPDAGVVALLRSDGRGILIEAATGEQMADLGVNPYLSSLSFSPDSRYLAALSVEQSSLWLWQMAEATPLVTIAIVPDQGADVAYAPDGSTIAIAWYGCQARIWDAPSGEILQMLEPADPGCVGGPEAVFSPDGSGLALASGTEAAGGITLWDYRSGEEIMHLSLEQGFVHSLAFSPDGQR
jgi:WD40 repeat protein